LEFSRPVNYQFVQVLFASADAFYINV